MTRRTTQQIVDMKATGEPIAMITAYDATFARLLEEAGADVLLVGDSLGMVVQGHESTLPVTMDQMVYHTAAVVRGSQRAMVVADLPFMSYQASVADAVRNGGRLLAETGCQAVKLEGGTRSADATLGRFNRGAFRLAKDSGVPVLPVAVYGSHFVMSKGSLPLKNLFTRIQVKVMAPLDSSQHSTARKLSNRTHEAIDAGLAELRKEFA